MFIIVCHVIQNIKHKYNVQPDEDPDLTKIASLMFGKKSWAV